MIVPMRLAPKATQIMAMAISKGHSSSAYSLEVVYPNGSVMAAPTIMSCQPQKLSLLNQSFHIRAFNSRWVE